MCTVLVRAGYEVIATDKRAEREPVARGCGADWRDTPAAAASAAGVLISMLPGPGEVHAAMLGETGALKGLAAGATWIDMTSNSPAAARPVQEQAMKQGVEVLEAPVGGGVAAAREGMLQLFVGGEASAVERHRAVLEALGDPGRIVHIGGHGTGYTDQSVDRVLVVLAHPDDAEFWVGGSVAHWTDAGSEVTYCVLSDGEAGGFDPATPRADPANPPR